jgi:hypothetical protein
VESTNLTPKEQALIASVLERLRVEFVGEAIDVRVIHMMNGPGGQYLWIQARCLDGQADPVWQTRSPILRAQIADGDIEGLAASKARFITTDWRAALGPGRGH